jgi:hypothetical protein
MHYTDSKRLDAKMRAIEDALSRIGEPITEAQAKTACSRWLQAGGNSCPVRG